MDNQQVRPYIEVWKVFKDVPRFEVSDLGNVRYVDTGKIKYTKPDKLGYVYLQYKEDGKRYNLKIHRMIAQTFIHNPDNLREVNHKDGNKSNNSVINLEWCTRQYNVQHAHELGLHNRKGIKNGRSVLTEELVHSICKWYEFSTENTPKLAAVKFKISIQQASKIRCGIAWKHISSQYKILPLKYRVNSRD